VDPRFTECRGAAHPEGEPALTVTGSLVDGSAAVLLVAAPVDEARLRRWVADLSTRYGDVTPRAANGQRMWQWVRQQRMIRLTTRLEGANRMVSVSLVDGPLLDGLNRRSE
jgi:hypothetical protein